MTPAALEHLEGWRRCLRLGPALRSSAAGKVSAEQGALPGSALGPAGETGSAGCCRWRAASPRCLPACPPRGEGGGAAAGPEALVPSGLKSARCKMASSPCLPPGGYLIVIIAFIRFCLPSSRTSSLARCPLEAGRMGRKTAASAPWFPALLPG